jgi:hypothetical protein
MYEAGKLSAHLLLQDEPNRVGQVQAAASGGSAMYPDADEQTACDIKKQYISKGICKDENLFVNHSN